MCDLFNIFFNWEAQAAALNMTSGGNFSAFFIFHLLSLALLTAALESAFFVKVCLCCLSQIASSMKDTAISGHSIRSHSRGIYNALSNLSVYLGKRRTCCFRNRFVAVRVRNKDFNLITGSFKSENICLCVLTRSFHLFNADIFSNAAVRSDFYKNP